MRTTSGAVKAATGRTLSILSSLLVALAVAGFFFLAVGPRVLGYQTSTMLTGSMAPLINPGDVVVTVPTLVADIRVGDVITYRIPVEDQRVETHRVAEILTNTDGSAAVRTKGDANDGVDPWTASFQGATVDKQVLTIPYVGQAIRALRQPVVLNTLMYGAPAVLLIGLLASIWRRDPEPESND
ncbi:signal peptidase I [Arthrobacter sp. W4I7]|uniref:signal peptidase I n=1 Tax=Arthrobacter sp. W4I7 TaxID=3042296 RepID=UPI0027847E37|nr:signal peptidase I [Arthrobacter sp. W4I7]MDQ0689931.1 signal peptidase [Arthrobacter sp. W4I7]